MSLPRNIIEGKFEVLHKISEGGMGEVYKVRHLLLDQAFVIKVIRAQHEGDENLRERFHREARAAIRLRHANIAEIHDFSIGKGGTAYIVMEFIDGATLKQILARQGPPALGLTMEIAAQSLKALSFLHRQGYLHRDVSPDNLMLTRSLDGEPLIKLIDLGLTKRLEGGGELTSTGMFLGKVRYSAPEQFQGKELDQRSDLYSFGVMLYELLTGRCPIQGEGFSALIGAHLLRPPLDFAATDPLDRVPPPLRRIVMQTLEKDPAERVATADELARLLAPFRRPDKAGSEELSKTIALSSKAPPADPVAAQSPPQEGEKTEKVEGLLEPEERERSRVASVARVEAHLASRELKEATAALAEAEREHGIDENTQELRTQLEELRHKEREERLKALLEKARRQIAVDEMVEALRTLQEAGEIDPQNVSAQALLIQVRTAIDRARAKPKRPRWILGVAAAAAPGLVILGWIFFQPPPAVEVPAAETPYGVAVEAFRNEDWQTARLYFERAIETDPEEKVEGPYLPHYFLGLVSARRHNCMNALKEWQESEQQGAVRETSEYQTLLDGRVECEAEFSGRVSTVERVIGNATRFAEPLKAALDNPDLDGFWIESPELLGDANRVLQDLDDLRAQFEDAKARKDFYEIDSLETPALEMEDRLDRLAKALADG